MGWFRSADKPTTADALLWSTNAPAAWPAFRAAALGTPVGTPLAQIALASALKNGGLEIARFMGGRLFDDGVLETPIEVGSPGGRVAVFVYTRADVDAAAHFADARARIVGRGEPEPVWYAPAPLPSAPPAPSVRPFDLHDLTMQAAPSGRYAMWTATCPPSVRNDITAFYEALDGCSTFAVGLLLKGWSVEEELRRFHLPEAPVSYGLVGPEERHILCTIGAEKGLRFHLAADAPPEYVARFWCHAAAWAVRVRDELAAGGATPDAPEDRRGRGWWALVDRTFQNLPAGETLDAAGVVFHEAGVADPPEQT